MISVQYVSNVPCMQAHPLAPYQVCDVSQRDRRPLNSPCRGDLCRHACPCTGGDIEVVILRCRPCPSKDALVTLPNAHITNARFHSYRDLAYARPPLTDSGLRLGLS